MKKHLSEIETQLSQHAKGKPTTYGSLKRLNIAVPVLRKLIKKRSFSFQSYPKAQVLEIWNHLWYNSQCFEIMNLALYQYQHTELNKAEFDCLIKWTDTCECWQHSDDLSKIHADIVEAHPEWILPIFETWNVSSNAWKRRQSIVGLIEYASKRKKVLPFDQLTRFITPLLKDEAYYVQKGIGWTLREVYNVYPEPTKQFIHQHIQDISSIAYSAATQKLDKETKRKLNGYRKEMRRRKGK